MYEFQQWHTKYNYNHVQKEWGKDGGIKWIT